LIEIRNLDSYELSDRAGTYGGKAGLKDGILIDGEYYIVKYPKTTKSMNVKYMSYTTAPLSEFIGSRIYEILGVPVHKTMLGIRNGKLVVACKDFCETEGALREIRTIKNQANPYLAHMLERDFSSTGSKHCVDLEEIMLHLKHNDILKNVPGINERFWDCTVIDCLINNNDRNNGNWGVLRKADTFQLAPVYDNGAAFSNKVSDKKIEKCLMSEQSLLSSALNGVSGYSVIKNGKEHVLTSREFMKLDIPELDEAIIRNVPLIKDNLQHIRNFFDEIPESYDNIYVCSKARREFYYRGLEARLNKILIPKYEKIKSPDPGLQNIQNKRKINKR